MSTIKDLYQKYREVLSYLLFGVLTTLVNLVVFQLCSSLLGSNLYLISNGIAWVAAVIFAYITNKLFVFRSKSWQAQVILKEMLSFFAARVLSFLIEEAGLVLFVELLAFKNLSWSLGFFTLSGEMLAKLILAVIVVILNYIFSKWFIFKKNKQ